MSDAGVAYVQLLPSMRGFSSAVSKEMKGAMDGPADEAGKSAGKSFMTSFSQSLQSGGRAMSGLGDKLTVGLTAPLLLGANKAANAASDLGESVNATNVVFGEGIDIIDRFAANSAQAMGLSERAFREAITPIGAQLQNLGFSQDEAAQSSGDLAARASDMASVFNTDVDQALAAIAAGLRGEADPLEQFGVGMSVAAVQAHALSSGLGQTTVDMAKVERATINVEKAQVAAADAIAKHGEDSLEARDSAAKLAAQEDKLAEALAGGTVELTDQEMAQARLSLLMEQTDRIAGDFAATSDQLANQERIMAAEAENAAAAFGQNLLPMKQKVIEVAGQLLDKFNELSPAQQQMAVKAGMVAAALGPVLSITGRLVTGIGGTIRAVGSLGRGLATVGRGGVQVVGFLGRMAMGFGRLALAAGRASLAVLRAFVQMAAKAAAAAARVVAQIALQIARWVALAAASLASAAMVALAWIISLGPIALVVAAVIAAVALIIANWDTVVKYVTAAASWIWEHVSAIFTAIKDWVGARIDDVAGFIQALPGRVNSFVTRIKDHYVTQFNLIRDFVNGRIDAIVGFFTALPGRVNGFVTKIKLWIFTSFRQAQDWVKARLDAVVGFFRSLPGRIGSAMRTLASKVSQPFIDAFNKIKSWWNKTVGGFGFNIPKWVPKVGGRGFSIPKMHQGGIFDPGANEGLALLQRGEGVFTPDQMRALGTVGSAQEKTVVLAVSPGADALFQQWVQNLVRTQGGGSVQRTFGQGAAA